ncbi:MAG: UMP kinase, partial [Elusimicrobiota bacterium]|nr:UMP kinase [Elusimicrobiota bacterium]
KRILIKLSGEMLGEAGAGFSMTSAGNVASEIKQVYSKDLDIAVLVGGGNIMRFRDSREIDRLSADFMGMTATIINALGLQNALKKAGIEAVIQSALNIEQITEGLSVSQSELFFTEGRVVIFAGGTGAPFFTTDTAAALRALEIGADIILKATKVDGVYDCDPAKNSVAKLYREDLTFDEALSKDLKIMDSAALAILKEGNVGVRVFNFNKAGNLAKIIAGEDIGTYIG